MSEYVLRKKKLGLREKKEYTPPPWHPSFLGLSPDSEVTQQEKLWCIPCFPGKTREKGIHHRSGKKGIHHRASDPTQKIKRRVSTVVVYTFFFQTLLCWGLRASPSKPSTVCILYCHMQPIKRRTLSQLTTSLHAILTRIFTDRLKNTIGPKMITHTHLYHFGINSELFGIGPVQFSWPRGVAENWFTKPGFWEHFVDFS